ncbi:hypothetical protein F5877DRAFT_85813 [Lentinula edodes]|nr:hypothetical protein F5877DRAFT_85813 [Lentinula edodes]
MASTETVKLFWKCCVPNDGDIVELCESLMIKSALKQVPTLLLFDATKTSFSVRWRVTDPPAPGVPEALPDLPNSPNPVIWPIDYAETLVEIQAEKLARSIDRSRHY